MGLRDSKLALPSLTLAAMTLWQGLEALLQEAQPLTGGAARLAAAAAKAAAVLQRTAVAVVYLLSLAEHRLRLGCVCGRPARRRAAAATGCAAAAPAATVVQQQQQQQAAAAVVIVHRSSSTEGAALTGSLLVTGRALGVAWAAQAAAAAAVAAAQRPARACSAPQRRPLLAGGLALWLLLRGRALR